MTLAKESPPRVALLSSVPELSRLCCALPGRHLCETSLGSATGRAFGVEKSTKLHIQEKEEEIGQFIHEAVMGSAKSYPHTPTVIDGVVLPKTPEELQAERKFRTVPYIIGFNKKEFGWFLPTLMGYPLSEGKLNQKTAMSLLWKSYPLVHIPKELIPEAIEKYLGGTDDPVKKKDLFLDLMGDVLFGVPSVIVARNHRDAGAPTYMYEFQYRPSFSSDMKPKTVIGDHGDELFSVLGAPFLKEGASEEEIRLSKMVMKFWANFARNGNPNGKGLPHWPEYNQKEGYLQIGANTQEAQKLKDKEVAFWTNLFAKKAMEKPPQTEHIEL
ncbi:liver carboxylesterase 1-like [Hylobates moloch]|uniref:liver carboxylesterase 1-like n=1 Tax=Hylobates moloch TaxID=81572 RepID=UPI0026761D96|nr:liver carboxylesterase 1-like [Hylobates moloch]